MPGPACPNPSALPRAHSPPRPGAQRLAAPEKGDRGYPMKSGAIN